MNRIVGKLLVPQDTEYLAINRELLIVETSTDVKSFADCPHEVMKGKDIRLGFPELVGIEDAVITTDASGQIKYLNPVAEKLTGWKLQDVRRQPISQIIQIVN